MPQHFSTTNLFWFKWKWLWVRKVCYLSSIVQMRGFKRYPPDRSAYFDAKLFRRERLLFPQTDDLLYTISVSIFCVNISIFKHISIHQANLHGTIAEGSTVPPHLRTRFPQGVIIFEKGLSYFYNCNCSIFHSTESSRVRPHLF